MHFHHEFHRYYYTHLFPRGSYQQLDWDFDVAGLMPAASSYSVATCSQQKLYRRKLLLRWNRIWALRSKPHRSLTDDYANQLIKRNVESYSPRWLVVYVGKSIEQGLDVVCCWWLRARKRGWQKSSRGRRRRHCYMLPPAPVCCEGAIKL